jgi:hypothetical protein
VTPSNLLDNDRKTIIASPSFNAAVAQLQAQHVATIKHGSSTMGRKP